MAQSSGTYNFNPAISELVLDAYARIQMFGPSLGASHLIEARRSLNLWLSDRSGNYGINLAQIQMIDIPLLPGQFQFPLPANVMQVLDVYLRTFTPSTGTAVNIGNNLTPLGPPGNPFVAQPFGDPLILQPASGTLSSVAGSPLTTLRWPSHGLVQGDPIFWGCPVSIGGQVISVFSIVSNVVDVNTLQFSAPLPALETQTLQGATPLFSTNTGSPNVNVILPNHGLSIGEMFTVSIAITIGGFVIAANTTETVTAVASPYQFSFQPGGSASSTASAFLNGGKIPVSSQQATAANTAVQDIILFPLSRNDYAAIPQKYVQGRPTSFWFNRVVPPNFSIYPVTPPGFYYGFMAYCMLQYQDANPVSGQVLGAPNRAWEAITAGLCSKLAEKYAPAQHQAKIALAEAAWQRFADADIEHVQMSIKPALQGYFR